MNAIAEATGVRPYSIYRFMGGGGLRIETAEKLMRLLKVRVIDK